MSFESSQREFCLWDFPGNHQKGLVVTISGKYAFQSISLGLQFHSSSFSGFSAAVFLFCFVLPLISSQWFLRWPQTWEKRMGIGKLKHHKTHYSYWNSAIFHEKILLDCCKPLVIFQLLKLVLTVFISFLNCFFAGNFHRSLLCPLFSVTLSLLMASLETLEFVILMKPNLLIFYDFCFWFCNEDSF